MIKQSNQSEANYLKKLGITIPNPKFFQEEISYYGFQEICLQYLDHFLVKNQKGDLHVKAPTSFTQIYNFYSLDQSLKNTLMIAVQLLEQTFKTALVTAIKKSPETLALKEKYQLNSGRIIRRGDLKTRIRRISKNYFLPYKSYAKTHQHIDKWVLIKEMSFGVACNYFFLLPNQVQKRIVNSFLRKPTSVLEVENIFAILRLFRNQAAHNYRLIGIRGSKHSLYDEVIADLKLLKNQEPYFQAKKNCQQIITVYLEKYPAEKAYLEANFSLLEK